MPFSTGTPDDSGEVVSDSESLDPDHPDKIPPYNEDDDKEMRERLDGLADDEVELQFGFSRQEVIRRLEMVKEQHENKIASIKRKRNSPNNNQEQAKKPNGANEVPQH